VHVFYCYQETKANMPFQLIPKGIVTAEVAAERSGFTPTYVRRLAARGIIIGTKHGNQWLIDIDSLLAYKDRMRAIGTQKHTPHSKRHKEDPDATN
jgi:hypothetical protein